MGKLSDLDLDLNHAVAENDQLRALTGRQRIDTMARLATSDTRVAELVAKREQVVREDANAARIAHEERLKAAAADVVASGDAEKLASSIDADVEALVAKFAKLNTMTATCYERTKQRALDSLGLQDLTDRIHTNQKWVATAVGKDRVAAAAEQAWLNTQYTFWLTEMRSAIEPLVGAHPTTPQAAEALTNAFQRIRAAWSGENVASKRLTLAAAYAGRTQTLVEHVETIKQKAPTP
jgi:hypothetical protein